MSLDELFAFIPDAAVAVDRAGRIVAANVHAEGLFGYDRDALIGETIEVLVPERFAGTHPGFRAGYQASPHIRRMGAASTSLFGRRSDASEFPVEIMLAPFEVGGGVLTVAVISDLTWHDRQQAASRLATILETNGRRHAGEGPQRSDHSLECCGRAVIRVLGRGDRRPARVGDRPG
jgi:PAS domain S-box-containing protein